MASQSVYGVFFLLRKKCHKNIFTLNLEGHNVSYILWISKLYWKRNVPLRIYEDVNDFNIKIRNLRQKETGSKVL